MDKEIKRPTEEQQLKAALIIEIALSQMPKPKKPLSEKERKFREALGVRLRVEEKKAGDQ
jgi:hypothetical protein